MELYDTKLRNQAKEEAMKRGPWSYNRDSKHQRVPMDEEIANKIVSIAQFDHQMAAFLSVFYLTGARLHEILPYSYKGIANQELHIRKHGLRLKDIYGDEDPDGKRWVYIITRVQKLFKSGKDMNLKQREEQLKKTQYKRAIIAYAQDDPLLPLIEVLDSYLDQLSHVAPETELFTFSGRKADRFMNKYLGISPHTLRNWRASNFVRYYGFSASDLKKFFGWRSSNMPLHYSQSDEEIIKKRLSGEF